jgi:hypothetical protein
MLSLNLARDIRRRVLLAKKSSKPLEAGSHLVEQLSEALELRFELPIVILEDLHSSFEASFVLSQKFRFGHHVLKRARKLLLRTFETEATGGRTCPCPFPCVGVV